MVIPAMANSIICAKKCERQLSADAAHRLIAAERRVEMAHL